MIKRILGVLGVIFGVLGVLLAVVQLIGIWIANPSITRGLQGAVGTMNQGLVVSHQVLTNSDMIAGDLRTELKSREGSLQPVMDRYRAGLAQIQVTVDSTRSAIDLSQEFIATVNSVPLLARSVGDLPQGERLAEVSQTLENLSQTLTDLQQESPRLAEASQEVRDRIDTRLGEVEGNIEQLIAIVEQKQAALSRIEARIPYMVTMGSVALSLIAIWFGLAQYCLLLLSWRWVKEKEPVGQEVQES
ncbi:MAG: hypothetical protein KDJ65_28310 [Anaerolineae bacterium]|nr:hypothetical protein [Anaerolineae bacterium]